MSNLIIKNHKGETRASYDDGNLTLEFYTKKEKDIWYLSGITSFVRRREALPTAKESSEGKKNA
jgi:hypothetical protein